MLRLNETDLRYLVETVATSRRDYDRIVNLIRDKDDLLEPMLEDAKLAERLFRDDKSFTCISPHLLFSVLLRRLRKDLEQETYVLEVDPRGKRIPVFAAPAVAGLLSDKPLRDYLAEMLASFARTNSGTVYWKERGTWHKRRFSDIDPDDMIELARIIDPEMRPALYKRIADLSLFLSGIFPDYAGVARARGPRLSNRRTLGDHEHEGTRFYRLAALQPAQLGWRPILETLSENFALARRALNTLSDRYLKVQRAQYFNFPAEN